MTPEERARKKIDGLLTEAGWLVQDREEMNLGAGLGVAVREYPLPSGECDYLLFVDRRAAGVIEAKPEGVTLTSVAEQSTKYMQPLPAQLRSFGPNLLFDYESTGSETLFRDVRDPDARSRRVFAFHRPEALLAWATAPDTLRARLQRMPPLDPAGLRQCQIEAIAGTAQQTGLEASLARGDPRALIQMATGAGKTWLACTFAYRLAKFAKAHRILFLVDRDNLGLQTLREFQQYIPPDDPRRFTSLYVVQHLKSNTIEESAKVVITTIQRLYAMLRGEDLPPEAEEVSAFETAVDDAAQRPVGYARRLPIESFDFIVTDECHRSIYGQWRQVLEYFDAFIIGLTATPAPHTLGFFNLNLVAEYPYERSVVDGVNVSFEIFRIRTRISRDGSAIDAGYEVPVMDKRTRRRRYEELDARLDYLAAQLDRSVTAPNQIRTVLRTYRDRLFVDLFPGRRDVPKTLIFAKDDNHAETITEIAREVFGRGNDFCKKITYQAEDPKALLKSFRIDPQPRMVVTVDMIATGTDVKPIEVLIFLRDVKSEIYFEQMKGRGVRSISIDDLLLVTPDAAGGKQRFVIVDAVGVTESCKTTMRPLERQRRVSFATLVDHVAAGDRRDDTFSSLAARLTALDRVLSDDDRVEITRLAGGREPKALAAALLAATDADVIEAAVLAAHGPAATEDEREAVAAGLKEEAARPFDSPALRQRLKDCRQRAELIIDEISIDEVIGADFDMRRAETTAGRFRAFIEQNRDGLIALAILYGTPAAGRRLTYADLEELAKALTAPPWVLDTAEVWRAYKRLDAARVRGLPMEKVLTELVALVRFATGQTDVLESFAVGVEQRFNLWIGRQKKAGRSFSDEQIEWLALIKGFIAQNVEIGVRDILDQPSFTHAGGLGKARTLFGADQLPPLLDELTQALVA